MLTNLNGLQNLAYLTELDLAHNGLGRLDGLDVLKSLTLLRAYQCKLTDIGGLEGMNIVEMDLRWNQLENIKPLQQLKKLQKLELTDNLIQDIRPLWCVTSLTSLYISNNKIVETNQLQVFRYLNKVEYLSYGNNPFMDNHNKQTEFFLNKIVKKVVEIVYDRGPEEYVIYTLLNENPQALEQDAEWPYDFIDNQ